MAKRLSQLTIDQVKQYGGIVDFIGQYVQLSRRGQNYIGLCPFHSEKTPSFTVSPNKKIFHCFGCHESGDLISFCEKIDHLSFVESVESIAQFAGISIDYDDVSSKEKIIFSLRQKIYECLTHASDFFCSQLSSNSDVLSYVQNRKMTDNSIAAFQLGFCASSKMLFDFLQEKNVEKKTIFDSGLFVESSSNLYSRFQNRLVFPIKDFQGRVVGFGGRILTNQKDTAKYVNSDESLMFNKRKLLYGIDLAKSSIRKETYVILVEGYMDVIMCNQYGIKNVIACMGTALTSEQITLIKRVTNRVLLMFDNDQAGQQSMFKSIQQLLKDKIEVQVVCLNEYDPADYLVKYGKDMFLDIIHQSLSALDFIFDFIKKQHDLSSIQAVSRCVNQLIPYIISVDDDIVRIHYIRKICRELKVDEDLLVANIDKVRYNNVDFSKFLFKKDNFRVNKVIKAESFIVSALSVNKNLRELMKGVSLDIIKDLRKRQICGDILNTELEGSSLISTYDDTKKKLITQCMIEMPDYETELALKKGFNDCLQVLQLNYQDDLKKSLVSKIKDLEEKGDEQELDNVMAKLDQLKKGVINGIED